jgi:hypothetical protein
MTTPRRTTRAAVSSDTTESDAGSAALAMRGRCSNATTA